MSQYCHLTDCKFWGDSKSCPCVDCVSNTQVDGTYAMYAPVVDEPEFAEPIFNNRSATWWREHSELCKEIEDYEAARELVKDISAMEKEGADFSDVDGVLEFNPVCDTTVEGKEVVREPEHYTRFRIEPITFIMGNDLDFETGNIVKYAVRAGSKIYPGKTEEESAIIDLEKVRRYAEMKINKIKGKEVL